MPSGVTGRASRGSEGDVIIEQLVENLGIVLVLSTGAVAAIAALVIAWLRLNRK